MNHLVKSLQATVPMTKITYFGRRSNFMGSVTPRNLQWLPLQVTRIPDLPPSGYYRVWESTLSTGLDDRSSLDVFVRFAWSPTHENLGYTDLPAPRVLVYLPFRSLRSP